MVVIHTIIALVMAASSLPGGQPSDLPRDFAIRFELGLCWRDLVDTRTDRYVRDLANGKGEKQTVRLQLTDTQWRDLWRWVEQSRFFALPSEINASQWKVYEGGTWKMTHPSPRYAVDVHGGGRRHRVDFDDDNSEATTDSLDRIRRLVTQLEEFFTQLPQVKRLPKPAVGCL